MTFGVLLMRYITCIIITQGVLWNIQRRLQHEWRASRICTRAYFIFGILYINDLEEGVTGNILKFADDSKLFRKTKEIGDKQKLQDYIDKLVRWSEKWRMLFNFGKLGKCKCLHTGPGNTGMNYEMGGTILSKTVKEKYLGVSMNANMKVSEQCRMAASKGNQILGMIRRNITYKENSLIVPLYKAIDRPHLEYCIQAWSPHLRKDIDILEKIQRRATKLIPGLIIIIIIIITLFKHHNPK